MNRRPQPTTDVGTGKCEQGGMTQHPPALVGISHGTSSDAGRRSVRGLHDAVAAAMAQRHPDATPRVRLGHVDVEPADPAHQSAREVDERVGHPAALHERTGEDERRHGQQNPAL